MRWFRLYTDVLHDPKVQRLRPSDFKNWINILCIANRSQERGILPPVDDVAFALRVKPVEAEKILTQLEARGLLDRDEHGRFFPHNWTERQRNSDDGATRQQRYREKKRRENSEISKNVTSPSRYGDALDIDIDKENTSVANKSSTTVAFDQSSGRFVGITDSMLTKWQTTFPDLDVHAEISKAEVWTVANPAKTKKNWHRFIVGWLGRAKPTTATVTVDNSYLSDPAFTDEVSFYE